MQYAYWIIPSIWYTTTQDKYKISWSCLLSLIDKIKICHTSALIHFYTQFNTITQYSDFETISQLYIKRHMLEAVF